MSPPVERRLQSITIKPTGICRNDCPYCSDRKKFLAIHHGKHVLKLDDWCQIIRDAGLLGAERIDISGGEPTLYPHLGELVTECKRHMYTSISSNGDNFSLTMAAELRRLQVDNVSISLMSLQEHTHDRIRQRQGSHRRAVDAIRFCSDIGIHVTVHFILSRHNYAELPDLVSFIRRMNVRAFVLAYPENDYDQQYLLMDRRQINDFKTAVVPRTRDVFAGMFDYDIGDVLNKLFTEPDGCDYAAGVYNQSDTVCSIPYTFMLVYPDGSVLPCNAVEYSHSPLVGNARENTLAAIWQGQEFESFRASQYAFCRRCPMQQMVHHYV